MLLGEVGAGTAGREAPARGGRGVRAALLRADGRGQGASAVRLSPVPSGIPRARFRDWIAAPAVPLTRLSSAEMTVAWPLRRSTTAPTRKVVAPATSPVVGKPPSGSAGAERS